jgi:hypothetical protein
MLGGTVQLASFIDYLLSLKEKGCLDAETTAEQLLRCIFSISSDSAVVVDSGSLLRKLHYEDFLEYLCRIVVSEYWILSEEAAAALGGDNLDNEGEGMSEAKQQGLEDEFDVIPSLPAESSTSTVDKPCQLMLSRLENWFLTL